MADKRRLFSPDVGDTRGETHRSTTPGVARLVAALLAALIGGLMPVFGHVLAPPSASADSVACYSDLSALASSNPVSQQQQLVGVERDCAAESVTGVLGSLLSSLQARVDALPQSPAVNSFGSELGVLIQTVESAACGLPFASWMAQQGQQCSVTVAENISAASVSCDAGLLPPDLPRTTLNPVCLAGGAVLLVAFVGLGAAGLAVELLITPPPFVISVGSSPGTSGTSRNCSGSHCLVANGDAVPVFTGINELTIVFACGALAYYDASQTQVSCVLNEYASPSATTPLNTFQSLPVLNSLPGPIAVSGEQATLAFTPGHQYEVCYGGNASYLEAVLGAQNIAIPPPTPACTPRVNEPAPPV